MGKTNKQKGGPPVEPKPPKPKPPATVPLSTRNTGEFSGKK